MRFDSAAKSSSEAYWPCRGGGAGTVGADCQGASGQRRDGWAAGEQQRRPGAVGGCGASCKPAERARWGTAEEDAQKPWGPRSPAGRSSGRGTHPSCARSRACGRGEGRNRGGGALGGASKRWGRAGGCGQAPRRVWDCTLPSPAAACTALPRPCAWAPPGRGRSRVGDAAGERAANHVPELCVAHLAAGVAVDAKVLGAKGRRGANAGVTRRGGARGGRGARWSPRARAALARRQRWQQPGSMPPMQTATV